MVIWRRSRDGGGESWEVWARPWGDLGNVVGWAVGSEMQQSAGPFSLAPWSSTLGLSRGDLVMSSSALAGVLRRWWGGLARLGPVLGDGLGGRWRGLRAPKSMLRSPPLAPGSSIFGLSRGVLRRSSFVLAAALERWWGVLGSPGTIPGMPWRRNWLGFGGQNATKCWTTFFRPLV